MGIMATGTGNRRVDVSALEVAVFPILVLGILTGVAGEIPLERPEQIGAVGDETLVGIMADRAFYDVLRFVHRLTGRRNLLNISPVSCSQTCLAAAGVSLEEKLVRPERRPFRVGVGMGGLIEARKERGMTAGLTALLGLGNGERHRPDTPVHAAAAVTILALDALHGRMGGICQAWAMILPVISLVVL